MLSEATDYELSTAIVDIERAFECSVRIENRMELGVDLLGMSKRVSPENFRTYISLCRELRARQSRKR